MSRPTAGFRLFNHPVCRYVLSKGHILFSKKYLLVTNTAICVTMSCTGDVLQQNYEILSKEQQKWNKRRTGHISVTGFVIGPMCHYWYIILDKYFPGRTLSVIAKKILLDQLLCSPILIAIFLVTLGLLERSSSSTIKKDVVTLGKQLYIADLLIWPPAQLINFFFLPTRFRVLYDNTISLGFDCYFSKVKYRKQAKE